MDLSSLGIKNSPTNLSDSSSQESSNQSSPTIVPKKGSYTTLFFVGFFVILLLNVFTTVKAGTVKVVTRMGKVNRTLSPGLGFKIPLVEKTVTLNTKKITYETSNEEAQNTSLANYKDYPVNTTTSDGQGVEVTYTIRFRIDADKATWIVENIGSEKDAVEKVVKTESRGWVRTIVRDFKAGDLYSGNIREVQQEVFEILRPKFADNGIELDELILREPRFDEQYEAIMEAKQKAAEQVEVEKKIAEQELYRKEQKITAAEGQAQEQQLQKETLSPQMLTKMWIEALASGQVVLPQTVIIGSGSDLKDFILNLPTL